MPMRWRDLAVMALIAPLATIARAQTCQTYPNTLTNGTTADASQVMANFNCAALTGAALFTGSVGVDTTTPADILDVFGPVVLGANTERLSLNSGSVAFNRRASNGQIYNSSVYAYQFQHNGGATNTTDILALQVYTPAGASVTGDALTVNGAGNVAVGTTPTTYNFYVNGSAAGTSAWVNASDARLKKDVTQIPNALGLVERLRGVRFEWKSAEERTVGKSLTLPVGSPQMGFIAQEVEAVVPEAVTAPKPGSSDTYGMSDRALVAILVEAVKAQQIEINELRAKLAAMTPAR